MRLLCSAVHNPSATAVWRSGQAMSGSHQHRLCLQPCPVSIRSAASHAAPQVVLKEARPGRSSSSASLCRTGRKGRYGTRPAAPPSHARRHTAGWSSSPARSSANSPPWAWRSPAACPMPGGCTHLLRMRALGCARRKDGGEKHVAVCRRRAGKRKRRAAQAQRRLEQLACIGMAAELSCVHATSAPEGAPCCEPPMNVGGTLLLACRTAGHGPVPTKYVRSTACSSGVKQTRQSLVLWIRRVQTSSWSRMQA